MRQQSRPWMRRFGIWLATIMAVTAAAVGVAAAPAMAATCYSNGCNGLDPSATGCDVGAYTLEDFIPPASGYALVELRYSPTCHAAWARYTTGAPGYPLYKNLRLQVWNSSSGGSMYTYLNFYIDGTAASGERDWTRMWSFTKWNQACVKNNDGVGPCTARR